MGPVTFVHQKEYLKRHIKKYQDERGDRTEIMHLYLRHKTETLLQQRQFLIRKRVVCDTLIYN